VVSWAAPTALSLVAVVAGCQGRPPPRAPVLPTVGVVRVELRPARETHEWIAQVDGSTTAEIRPQVSGYIHDVNYREGSHVVSGELLFTIDERPFVAAVEQARGGYENAVAELNKARADVARYTPLAVDHAISREQLENARAAAHADEATVKGAKGALETAQLNLKWAKVRSPVDGLAGIAQVRVGSLVNPNQVLTVVSTVDQMRASFNLRQQDYLRYAAEINAAPDDPPDAGGRTFELVLIDGRVYPHRAHDIVVNREIEPTTGTLQVQVMFPNPEGLLRPGLFGKIRLHVGSNEPRMVVPEKAVTQLQGQYQVGVVDSQQQVQVRRIEVGFQSDHLYVVESGLQPGERVIVQGMQNAVPGVKVNVEQAQWPAPPDAGASDGSSDGARPPDARD
jgi:RND family efflux transporter MFP subunit